jgi:hypothetical protein
MPEFLDNWKELDNRSKAASFAVRRSLHLHGVVDLEEVMYLLEALATDGQTITWEASTTSFVCSEAILRPA